MIGAAAEEADPGEFLALALPLVERGAAEGVGDDGRGALQERLEGGGGADADAEPRGGRVEIDVERALGAQALEVALHPLGGADDAVLLGAPRREGDRPPGRAVLARGRRQHPRALEHADEAGRGVVGAVDPGVVVAADEHARVVRVRLGAPQGRDDVGRRDQAAALLDREAHAQVGAPREPVAEGEAALPLRGDAVPAHAAHDLAGREPSDGLHRDRRQADLGGVEPLRVRRGLDVGRERIPRPRHGQQAPALDLVAVGPPALGGLDAAPEARVARVGVDDQAGGPGLLGVLRLVPPEVAAVAGDDDLALAVHAELGEAQEVLPAAVVGVDHLSLRDAAPRVGVPAAAQGAEIVRGGEG